MHPILQHPVGVRHALVLTQVLDPRLDHEGFHETADLRRVLEQSPVIGAIAAPLVRQSLRRRQESAAIAVGGELDIAP